MLVMCPSHIAKKWAREAIKTIPSVRTFLVEDMRNGGDPNQPHGVCEVRLRKGRIVYEGIQVSLAELRRLGRKGWKRRYPQPSIFIIPKDKGKLSYFWRQPSLQRNPVQNSAEPSTPTREFRFRMPAAKGLHAWSLIS